MLQKVLSVTDHERVGTFFQVGKQKVIHLY